MSPSRESSSDEPGGTADPRARWGVVVLYALAMAWVEAAVVLDLRTMTNRLDPYQAGPLPVIDRVTHAEMIREFATLLMLVAVGWLAGRSWRTRAGYSLIAFGIWDIGYYLFLVPLTGWPRSLLDWDVLFLLPLPWWGPVLAPVSIAALMIVWGTLVTARDAGDRVRSSPWGIWLAAAVGMSLALYVFMADALRVAGQGMRAVQNVLPVRFNWTLFGLAWLLMAVPVWDAATQALRRRRDMSDAGTAHDSR